MVADPAPDELRRLADEFDDFTFLFARLNPSGRWVRDAKFIEDAGNVEIATGLFADLAAGTEVLLCGVLRGLVRTVDDFEFADDPDVFASYYQGRLERLASDGRRRISFTVVGCWDTGDGFRRWSSHMPAVDAEHAELLVRADKTAGTFLVAAVVEGCVPVEDGDAVWATLDGQPAPSQSKPSWWRRLTRS